MKGFLFFLLVLFITVSLPFSGLGFAGSTQARMVSLDFPLIYESTLTLDPFEPPRIVAEEPQLLTVFFINEPSNMPSLRYVWSFEGKPDPISTDDRETTHTFTTPGQLEVTVKAFDKTSGQMSAMLKTPIMVVTPEQPVFDHQADQTSEQPPLQYSYYLDTAGNQVKHGIETAWHPNGQKKAEGMYQDGDRQGTWTYWYENGSTAQTGPYVNNVRHGLWTTYYPDGQKESEGSYRNNRRDGIWTFWEEDGNKSPDIEYRNGVVIHREETE